LWETSARKATIAGAVLGAATFAVYMVGSNRSFGYDAAATFANFIGTSSIWDAFAVRSVIPTIPVTQVATNDQVLISLVSHVIFSLTGSRSEVVYRVIPALAAGGVVGISTTVLTRRFGLLAGVCAGLFIATNPLFVDNSRDLRGYSLAALGSVVGTLALDRRRFVPYAIVMGLAIAAQLFAVVVLACHVAWLLARREGFREFLPAGLVAVAIGVAANAAIYFEELTRHGLPPPFFNPTFPRDLILFLVGAPVLLPVGLWLATAGLGAWTQRRRLWLWTTAGLPDGGGDQALVGAGAGRGRRSRRRGCRPGAHVPSGPTGAAAGGGGGREDPRVGTDGVRGAQRRAGPLRLHERLQGGHVSRPAFGLRCGRGGELGSGPGPARRGRAGIPWLDDAAGLLPGGGTTSLVGRGAGVNAVGRQLEDPDGPAAHAIAAPAEHDRVDPTGQDSRQQHLALLLVEQPTKDEVHQAGRLYREFPDKTQVRRLRICESGV
jgi:hypothetical protein